MKAGATGDGMPRPCSMEMQEAGLPFRADKCVRCGVGPCKRLPEAPYTVAQWEQRVADAFRARTEAQAKLIAAERAGLMNDPTGMNLPEELWRRYVVMAQAIQILTQRME